MSITDGQAAIINRIVTSGMSANIVLPYGPGAECPRYVIQVSGGSQSTVTMHGHTDSNPEIVVRVETTDEYATANDGLVSDLVAIFRPGAKFSGVTILDAPSPRAPLPVTDGVYSVPVVVRGRYSF